jgi:cytochrome c5
MKKFLTVTSAALLMITFAVSATAGDTDKGQGVYLNFCAPCHATGAAGAPKIGDKSAWSPRLKQGEKILIEHAIKGYQGKSGFMPARGGNSALSDTEIAKAVAYMAGQSK